MDPVFIPGPEPTLAASSDAAFLGQLDQDPNFPNLVFPARHKRHVPSQTDDNEVFSLAFEIMDKLS
jgi:hypothetical protein